MNFKKYFLLYTLIPLFVISALASYYRFMVVEDYLVEYEGDCNPEENSCFVGCEDDNCLTEYYYSIITKNASDLLRQCGSDITNCPSAQMCLDKDDGQCVINYCDPMNDDSNCDPTESKSSFDKIDNIEDTITPELLSETTI